MVQDESAVSQEFVGLSINHGSAPDLYEQPPQHPTGRSGVGVDITSQFFHAAKTLGPGELVKDGFFTLFESVGALEIMDRKMDSGCLQAGESLDPDYDLNRSLLPEEVLGIIDQLLCHEMAWHLGYPLSQTIFTNVYIDRLLMPPPESIEQADFFRGEDQPQDRPAMLTILRAYCLGLLKACWYVNERIRLEHYYEEEDFVTNTYQRNLLEKIDREAIRDALQDARALVHMLSHEISEEIATALDLRLELRYAFLRAIELSELRSNPSSLKTPWIQMSSILEPIHKSHALALPVPSAFSTKFQRNLASTMPPRPIVELSFEDAYKNFQRLFADGAEVGDVLTYFDSQSLLSFVMYFQTKKPQPLVYVRTLLQSYLFKDMVLLGSLSVRHILDDDLSIVALPCSSLLDRSNDEIEAPHDPRFVMAYQMETFRQRASQSFLDILRAFCQNRCRVRRTLCHSIQDWETVQIDAEEIDQLLQVQLEEEPLSYPGSAGGSGSGGSSSGGGDPTAYSLPLSSWAYLYKLRLMEWIVQLGFELEIYQADELAGMYWYLSYVSRTRSQHAERIRAFTARSLNDHRAGRSHHPLGSKQPLTAAKETEFTRSLSFLRLTLLDATVTWELADALSCLYAVLLRLGLAGRATPHPYGSDALRYDLRMRPFAPIGLPELPSHAAFARATQQPDVPTSALLAYADKALRGARQGCDALTRLEAREAFTLGGTHERWLAAATNCKRAVIAAGIAVATLRQELGRAGAEDGIAQRLKVEVPPPGKTYHEWWLVPKISRIP